MDNQHPSNSGTSDSDHEVFINFRGEDTRKGLINVLKNSMEEKGIRYFYDDKTMHPGDALSETLIRSIERSQVYLVVLSKNYAKSKWCLRELAHMVKCYQEESKYGRKVILPVFYGVSVETVKLKDGSAYKTDMKNLGVERKVLQDWEEALKMVPKFKGLPGDVGEGDLSKMIVREVQSRLQMRPLSYHMVGVDEQARRVEEMLDAGSGDVRFLVIYGKEGIGKTTVARAVFQQLSPRFQGSSFIADVTEMEKRYSYLHLKHKLLRDIFGDESNDDQTVDITKSFHDKEVLIVLDGVDHWTQIEELADSSTLFGPGSRIIITSSCLGIRHVQPGVHEHNSIPTREFLVYKMEEMKFYEASKLFNRYAFWQDSALENYQSRSRRIVSSCFGLPLILEIMGSLLHRNRNAKEWDGIAEELEKSTSIEEKLMISYNKLQRSAKKIFLDIACFFVNEEKTNPEYMWNDDEDDERIKALRALSLVKIVDGNKLWMHDSLRDLGRAIVLRNFMLPDRCRFWELKEALKVLGYAEGDQKVEAVCSHHYESERIPLPLTPLELSRKPELRFFRLYAVNFRGDFRNHLTKLRWLSWHYSPEVLEATHFTSASLVILDLARSHITAEWDGWRQLEEENNLKVIDLTSCKELARTPRFSPFKVLERVILEDCIKLVKIDVSIGELEHLKYLNVRGCDSLEGLPEQICSVTGLQEIHIMKKKRGRFRLPSNIGSLESLTNLEIVSVEMDAIPPSIGRLGKLQCLSLLRCSGFVKLPESVGDLTSLVELQISETEIRRLPDSIGRLKELKVIKMEGSSIMRLPCDIIRAEKLEEIHGKNSERLAGKIPIGIRKLWYLKVLELSNTSICKLPKTISKLSNLEKLQLPQCCKLQNSSNLPGSLTTLGITVGAPHKVQDLLDGLTTLEILELVIPKNTVCDNPLQLPAQLKSLRLSCLDLEHCVDVELPRNLSKLILENAVVRTTLQHFNNLENLSSLELRDCKFEDDNNNEGSSRPENVEAVMFAILNTLKHFYASGCHFPITNRLHLPEDLRVLHIDRCSFHSNVLQLSGLNSLKQLKVFKCNDLVEVEGLGELASLEELRIEGCSSLQRLGGDISNSKKLKFLRVVYNNELREVELPDEDFRKKLKFSELIGRSLPYNRRRRNIYSSRSRMEWGDYE